MARATARLGSESNDTGGREWEKDEERELPEDEEEGTGMTRRDIGEGCCLRGHSGTARSGGNDTRGRERVRKRGKGKLPDAEGRRNKSDKRGKEKQRILVRDVA